ncbi:MAG: hypothetical protein COA47_05205, partial [Robiginitomaculum sp.]
MSQRQLTAQQKSINDDPAYWDHFDAWWAQDFSWEGLVKHKIERHPDGHTLQDYWRDEERSLIDFAGKKWTRFHLPPQDLSGTKSQKWGNVNWSSKPWLSWQNMILEKLKIAKEFINPGWDERAQLRGVCFPNGFDLSRNSTQDKLSSKKKEQTIHINADYAFFGNRASFEHVHFGPMASFGYSYFGNNTRFNYVHFDREVRFQHTSFGFDTEFAHAQFDDWASFTNSRFDAWLGFSNCQFGVGTSFGGAIFRQKTSGTLLFAQAVDFTDTRFGAKLDFSGANFDGVAMFANCQFHPDSTFNDCTFALPPNGMNAADYQSAFRILRQHMETLRNHGQEMKFARLEMQARERRVGSSDLPNTVRWLSKAYGLFSDYGLNPLRPVLSLAGLFGLAGIGYWVLAVWGGFN